jgi:signal transduction histidine kinase/CheY-like chemotaxis protein
MASKRFIADLSFRAKMLMAVTIVMSLLVAVSLWLVSQRFKQQIQNNAADQLRTAEGVLRARQTTRADELFLRFNIANNEPKFKSAYALLAEGQLTAEGQETIRQTLQQMTNVVKADMIMLTPEPDSGPPVAVLRDPEVKADQFARQCAVSISQAFTNQSKMETVEIDGRLYDIVSLPITVGKDIGGVVTFGVADTIANEFRTLMRTDDDLVLLLDNQVVSSTLHNPDAEASAQFDALTAKSNSAGNSQEIDLGNGHFLELAGQLGEAEEPNRLGYLIFSSYEAPLQVLGYTQGIILLIGLLAIVSGVAVVWFLLHKMTGPLRELQVSAEAVGRGDFSRRVNIRAHDEFGKLGGAFNQMTQDIERSHTELQHTVNTLKTTQAQLVQSEKLSAVGEFVAGVAHELNNPLAAVMGFSEMLKDADVDEDLRRHLDLIFKSALRCRKIVQSLLSFARRHQPERKPVAVNKLIDEVLEIVAYQLKTSNVEVVTQFAPRLPLVLADGHQIQQVVLNLINNARQAIEAHQASGRITIRTDMQETVIRIAIQDNGPGISPENLTRIFDPFFTTKEVGKGTGLGLSLCYGLIREHGGNITVSSEPGKGATFTIELPATADLAPSDSPAPAKPEASRSQEGAGKKILLVDDEHILLEMIREGLKRHGYEITSANDGETALRELQTRNFDAICTDLKMPGLNGRQLYEWVRASRPDSARRVIFMTGDVINESLQMFLDQEQLACLHKPFSVADLRQAIKHILAETNGR